MQTVEAATNLLATNSSHNLLATNLLMPTSHMQAVVAAPNLLVIDLLATNLLMPPSHMQAVVAGHKALEGHVYRKALPSNPNDVVHAEVSQLVPNQSVVVAVGTLVFVGLDATHVPTRRVESLVMHMPKNSRYLFDTFQEMY